LESRKINPAAAPDIPGNAEATRLDEAARKAFTVWKEEMQPCQA
jgi:hypothetical protein